MRFTRLAAIALLACSISAVAWAGIIYTSGFGSGTDADQSAADSQALQQATNQAHEACPGMAVQDETVSDSCAPITANGNTVYECMVQVRTECQTPGK